MDAHVEPELARFGEGLLPVAEAERVQAHLDLCPACRAAAAEVRRGLSLVGRLERAPLPETAAARIRERLAAAPTADAGRLSPRRGLAAAAVLAAASVAGLVSSGIGQPTLRVDAGAPTRFEQAALDLNTAQADGRLSLDLVSSSVPEIRRWTQRTAGLDVSLGEARPAEDAGRFVLEGARAVHVGAATAVAVAYSVDGHPVTLLTARADGPLERVSEWTHTGKHVRLRKAGPRSLLAWTNSGQTYALVSDLPGFGRESCLLCHTTERRRAAIRSLQPAP